MKEKWLYKFVVNKTQKKVSTEKVKTESGEEIEKETVEELQIPHTVAILKPRRRAYEDAELFYGVKLADGIKAGLLTKPQIAKRYNNDGGDLSEAQKEYYGSLLVQKAKLLEEYQKLLIFSENGEEADKRKREITDTVIELQQEIDRFENERSSLFENTAENRASNQTIMWWIFNLSFYSDKQDPSDDDFQPVFKGETFDAKADFYDDLFDEENEFWMKAIRRLTFLVSLWNNGTVSDASGFKQLDELFQKEDEQGGVESEEEAVESAEEEAVESAEEKQSDPKKKRKSKQQDNEL